MKKISIGIYGGTGYTGRELVGLLNQHPHVEIAFASSESQSGKNLRRVMPQAPELQLISAAEADAIDVDCVFLCLPHTRSAQIAAAASQKGIRVIDLSADLRLGSSGDYEKWYGTAHPAPHLLPTHYGLPELNRAALHNAERVANPGCYATAINLGLAPLLRNGLIAENAAIIIDAKSGTTGAGRTPKTNILFSEVHGNLTPYNIGQVHRHIGEIETFLAPTGLQPGQLIFSPHLLPTDRGILAAIYVPVGDMTAALAAFETLYHHEPLVELLPAPELATLAHVVRTPKAAISLTPTGHSTLIIMVAIDNLLKGAASQAIQNFNLMFALPETLGLIPQEMVLQ